MSKLSHDRMKSAIEELADIDTLLARCDTNTKKPSVFRARITRTRPYSYDYCSMTLTTKEVKELATKRRTALVAEIKRLGKSLKICG